MKQLWLSLGSIAFLFFSGSSPQLAAEEKEVRYQIYELDNAVIHTVTVKSDRQLVVTPVAATELTGLEDFASQEDAIAIINGGYFDPQNQQTTSYITKDEVLIADPRTNKRLVENRDLALYMTQILNRSEFRRYRCGREFRYDITFHQELSPLGCQLVDALGGGPQLLPQLTSQEEGFVDYEDDEVIRDAIATNNPNARSAVAITDDGRIILAMAAQKSDSLPNSGVSLPQFAKFLADLGANKAMNLDGGSSASLYYRGQIFYGKIDEEGNKIERPIKSVLMVIPSL